MKKEIAWQIIAYVRLSDEDKEKTEDEKSESIKNQIKYLELYIETMKTKGENITGYKSIYDDGKTGTDIKRNGFRQAISLLEDGKYNCLLIPDLSRGFRNISDQTYYLEEHFPLHNIRFISTTLQYVDSYLLPDSAMNLGVKIQGISNEQFAYDTSIKIRKKFDMKRSIGEFIGAFAPYGYNKNPENKNKFVIDPVASEVVKEIFNWYVIHKMSIGGIVKKLNAQGIPCPTKYKHENGDKLGRPREIDGLWSHATIKTMLSSQTYIGDMVQKKEEVINYKVHKSRRIPKDDWLIVPNMHEPIIDQETFHQAQYLLSLNVRATKKGAVHPLAGMLQCADCRKTLARNNNAVNTNYYACSTYKKKGTQFCTKHSIRQDILYSMILDAINIQIRHIEDIYAVIGTVKEAPKKKANTKSLESRLEALEKSQATEKRVFEESYYDLKKGLISEEFFRQLRRSSEENIERIQTNIMAIKVEIEQITKGVDTSFEYFEMFLKHKGVTELTRELAVDLIEMVQVYEDQSVHVKFKFEDQFKLLINYLESQEIQLKLSKD